MEPLVSERTAVYRDLVGVRDIAERLGVSQQVVSNWARRNVGFPAPVTRLKMGPVFAWSQVQIWHSSWMKG